MDGDISQLLTTTTNLQPLLPDLITQEVLPDHVVASHDIDWVSLLSGSGSTPFDDSQNLPSSGTDAQTASTITDDVGISTEETHHAIAGKNKAKMISKVIKKATLPRFAFHTRSAEDVLDDGFRWRKYGQKSVKHSTHPRSYYRCTHHTCNVKKQIQRHSKDPGIVVTTYEGIHNHPCEKLMETLSPLLRQLQFLSSI